MNQSFYTAVSGAKSYQSGIDVTSTNIANVNTIGYRGSTAEFSNIFAKSYSENSQTLASDVGYGSTVSTTSLDMREGSYTGTDNTFDLAIAGEGWFGVNSTNIYDANSVGYTRNGVFNADVNSNLVNTSGNYLLGTNYSNIVADGDNYKIDLTAVPPKTSVTNQSKLFVPQNLTYPAVATSQINISSNLEGEGTKFVSASKDSSFSSIYNNTGELIDLNNGENMVVSVGNGNFSSTGSSLDLDLTFANEITNGKSSTITFSLNGKEITATIPDGAKARDVAAYMYSAIENANITGITTRVSGDKVTLSSEDTLNITNSTNVGILENTGAILATYSKNKIATNEFSTLEDLRGVVEKQINTISSNNNVYIDSNGGLKIVANDSFKLQISETTHSNKDLTAMINSLSSTYTENSNISSLGFQDRKKELNTDIITPNGDSKDMKITFHQTDTQNLLGGDSWKATGIIYEESPITATSDLGKVLNNNSSVDLFDGSNVWIRGGNLAPVSTDSGYGYKLTLNDDPLDGRASNLSFTLNDTPINLNILDGTKKDSIAQNMLSMLEAQGFSGEIDGENNIIINPKDSKIIINNGSSTLTGTSLEDFALQELKYDSTGSNGFKTTEDLLSQMNTTLTKINLNSSLNNGKITVNNTSGNEQFFSFLSGDNSNQNFLSTMSSLGGSISANSSINSNAIKAMQIASETTINLDFKENGEPANSHTMTLNNEGVAVNVDIGNIISASANRVLADSIQDNGIKQGNFTGYSVEENGEIRAAFNNKESISVGKVAVFHFQNDQGLERIGDNLFKSSNNSGNPLFYVDENGDVINSSIIRDKTLENSNISASTALTELILFQRSFEGASRAITTSDQLLQQAINMKK